jgi:hypothetical protein
MRREARRYDQVPINPRCAAMTEMHGRELGAVGEYEGQWGQNGDSRTINEPDPRSAGRYYLCEISVLG